MHAVVGEEVTPKGFGQQNKISGRSVRLQREEPPCSKMQLSTSFDKDWRKQSQGFRDFIRSAKDKSSNPTSQQPTVVENPKEWRNQSQGFRNFIRAARGAVLSADDGTTSSLVDKMCNFPNRVGLHERGNRTVT